MGVRRRTRRRAVIATAAVVHHENKKYAQQQAQAAGGQDQAPAQYDDQAPADDGYQAQQVPAPADPADEIEHLAQLHASGVLTDEEFTSAKAKILNS